MAGAQASCQSVWKPALPGLTFMNRVGVVTVCQFKANGMLFEKYKANKIRIH